MAKPEGATTRLLRDTMTQSLDAVNEKLIEAGEKAIDAATLGKRRSWIRKKDAGVGKKGKAKGFRVLGKAAAKKVKSKSRPPVLTPREGTFAEFVWRQPYDMDVKEVLKRAKAAKITAGSDSQIYTIRAKYPKSAPKLNPVASESALRAEDARARAAQGPDVDAISKARTVAPHNNASARRQFVLLVMSLGMNEAEALLHNYRQAHQRLEETLLGKLE